MRIVLEFSKGEDCEAEMASLVFRVTSVLKQLVVLFAYINEPGNGACVIFRDRRSAASHDNETLWSFKAPR